MNIPNIIATSSIFALLTACTVPHDLGDATGTETEGGSGSGNATDATTVGTSGMSSASDSQTGPDSTSSSTGDSTGVQETGSESSSDGTSTGNEVLEACEPSSSQARWSNSAFGLLEQLGALGSFVGVGACDLTIEDVGANEQGNVATLDLACVMDGSLDGDPLDQAAIDLQIFLDFTDEPAAFLATFSDSVSARIVVRSGGPNGGEAWLVVEQPQGEDAPMPVLIATSATQVEPQPAEYQSYYTGAWFGGPAFAEAVATCGPPEGACGENPTALAASWAGDEVVTHVDEMGSFASPLEETTYDVYPRELHRVDRLQCDDFPSTLYNFIAMARQP